MFVGQPGRQTATGGTRQITLLDQVGFDHVLEGIPLLAERRGETLDTDRTTVEAVDDAAQQAARMLETVRQENLVAGSAELIRAALRSVVKN